MTPVPATPALRIESVDKVYGDGTVALRGLSLDIPPDCFFGLIGPNGSGKSTLIGMTSGLVRAPAGRIFVFGHDVVADAGRARLELGLAPQDVHLDRFLTAREVLTYHGRYFGMSRDDADTRADELLGVFDLTGKAKAQPQRLSGGMRRRLLIARADAPATAARARRADGGRRRRAAPGTVELPALRPRARSHDDPAHDALALSLDPPRRPAV